MDRHLHSDRWCDLYRRGHCGRDGWLSQSPSSNPRSRATGVHRRQCHVPFRTLNDPYRDRQNPGLNVCSRRSTFTAAQTIVCRDWRLDWVLRHCVSGRGPMSARRKAAHDRSHALVQRRLLGARLPRRRRSSRSSLEAPSHSGAHWAQTWPVVNPAEILRPVRVFRPLPGFVPGDVLRRGVASAPDLVTEYLIRTGADVPSS